MVHERAEDVSDWTGGISVIPDPFDLEATAIRNLFDHRFLHTHSPASPGHHGASTELGRPVTIGIPYTGRRGCVAWDWKDTERAVWGEIDTSPSSCQQGCLEHVIRDPSWAALHRDGDSLYTRDAPLGYQDHGSV